MLGCSNACSVSSDLHTVKNETGKSLMVGDKVWINSASQVGGTENTIVKDNTFFPIISNNGGYLYGVGSYAGIYKVLGTSISPMLESFSSGSGVYGINGQKIWRFPKNTTLIPNYYSYLVRDDKIICSYLVQNGFVVIGTPGTRLLHRKGDRKIGEVDINTGAYLEDISMDSTSEEVSDFYWSGYDMILLEDKYIVTSDFYGSICLEINWDTRTYKKIASSNFSASSNVHITKDENYLIYPAISFKKKKSSLNYTSVSLKDVNKDLYKFLNTYDNIEYEYNDISQNLVVTGTLTKDSKVYYHILLVQYDESTQIWRTINNDLFSDKEYESWSYPSSISITPTFDTAYYVHNYQKNDGYYGTTYNNEVNQIIISTQCGLTANDYNAYSNKESTLTGYVSTGGNVNENVTVQTALPPKINQTISVNADNATIEVEL